MSKTKKPIAKLSELEPGQHADFFALLAERSLKSTRDGKPFYSCRFRDRGRSVAVAVWSDGPLFAECQAHWQPGQCFKIRGRYYEHERYGPQIEIEQIRIVEERDRAEGFSEADVREPSRFDPESQFAELLALLAEEVKDEPLRMLVERLLAAHADALKVLPASQRTFYPFPGGWLDHTLHVAKNSLWLADRYAERYPELVPPLNRDLVLAGAILHDIGRVMEFDPRSGPPARSTIDGELFGHLFLAHDLIRDTARDVPDLHPERLKLLLHIVISHLRIPEWGSPKLPCIPEVLIVHHADDLDAKFEMFARCLMNDPGDGPMTERDPVLNRPLLKSRSV